MGGGWCDQIWRVVLRHYAEIYTTTLVLEYLSCQAVLVTSASSGIKLDLFDPERRRPRRQLRFSLNKTLVLRLDSILPDFEPSKVKVSVM